MLKTLEQACKPRPSVFDQARQDTVYDLADLDRIDPNKFFEENFITQGMRQLLTEAFKRLEGGSSSASGAFLLSQSMGGGKTHNLVALGLLAKHPEMREAVMGEFHTPPASLGVIRTVAFTGRRTDTQYGIWGEIADQLGKSAEFNRFYSPLRAPGSDDWERLLQGQPTLIMLDELPPYFEAARGIEVGQTTLAHLTTAALSNLLVAIDKLPNVCLVLTDLRSSVYSSGHDAINEALANLDHEANRSVQRIDPVRLNTDELYDILRTRLFESVPENEDVEAVADAFRDALDQAVKMDLTVASPPELRKQIIESYPFHPGIRDLYARFRENSGFQQTRALIRIMRMIVSEIWESGAASEKYLIGAHDIDLNDRELISEIRQINGTLENAIAHDIAAAGGATAEQIDAERGGSDAQDAAKLIFLSSLSLATNPVLGLDRSTIIQYLVSPGRQIAQLRVALDALQSPGGAWYLHATSSGALLFKNTENLNAKLESYAHSVQPEIRVNELRDRLASMFAPELKVCYQVVEPLPALNEVQLAAERVTLVIFRPSSEAFGEIQRFWGEQQYRNRVLFLTGNTTTFARVLERAATLRAIGQIIGEFERDGMREDDPQLRDAREMERREQSAFYFACRESFVRLYYPSSEGLTPIEMDFQYEANRFKGEEQIVQALETVYKFRKDGDTDWDAFRRNVEEKLWPQNQKEVQWSQIRQLAASNPGWEWRHPRALDDLLNEMVRRDQWRGPNGGFVERGPFDRDPTSVAVQELRRLDDTGEATLRIRPLHGDRVYKSADGPATTASELIDHNVDFSTRRMKLWFLSEDSSGDYETGESVLWTNSITLQHRFYSKGDQQMCELKAIPGGEIRYTTDGSSPANAGHVYDEPFEVPAGTRLVIAQAEYDGILSEVRQWTPPDKAKDVELDPQKPAIWAHKWRKDATREVYEFLELVGKHNVELGFVAIGINSSDNRFWDLQGSPDLFSSPETVQKLADAIRESLDGGNLSLDVRAMRFPTGRDLRDLSDALKITVDIKEVKQ